jgi:hypothetical protein
VSVVPGDVSRAEAGGGEAGVRWGCQLELARMPETAEKMEETMQ